MYKISLFLLITVICKMACGIELSVTVLSKQGKPIEGMVVYLDSNKQVADNLLKPVVIAQAGSRFSPYLSVAAKNQPVHFINEDKITHHIYSVSGQNRFSFKLSSGEQNSQQVFSNLAEVAMGCNVHDWMSGYLLIVDSSYYGKTDVNGAITFSKLMPDTIKVTIWHPQLTTKNNRMEKTVFLQQSEQIQFRLTALMADIPKQEGVDDFDFLDDY